MARANRYAFELLTGIALLFAMGVSPSMAADRYVATTGSDVANNCTNQLMPCMTIQHAINQASPNDTVHVAAGLYLEPAPGPLTINKTLTLLGAQTATDARFPRGPESIVNDAQGTSVSASGVVIDGFTFQNSVASFPGFGIWLNPGISGTQIVNNIIQDNIVGIGLANATTPALIQHNLIQNNNRPGAASGTGIYTDQFSGGPTVRNVLIEENVFRGHVDAGIDSSNTDFANGVFNLDVDTNAFDLNGRAVILFNTHMSAFHDNTVTNSGPFVSAAIRLFDNNTQLSIFRNNLSNGVGHAIRLSNSLGFPSSDVIINQNNIGTVGPLSFALTGLTVDPLPAGHLGTVNAECNWWGASTGPFNLPTNPSGGGEEVAGDADFTPWLLSPAPSGPCLGGIPSTPGKVTGGGHIGSDPVFSPLGDLLSLPALIPSLANPTTEQATFGFVAKCCAPSGNLQYQDHGAEVRIKAETVDGLFISPSTSCAAPGGKHATFTGMASVIRPTGTTTERYTVDVDDCGEPGSSDTFGIKTATYANGPSTLIGGNIQIR